MMRIWKYTGSVNIFLIALILAGCESDYTRTVKAENAKGIRHDSLLLGIKFRHTRNDFYGICFDLNQKHVVSQGVGYSVRYVFVDSVTQSKPMPIQMFFFPGFDTLQNINAMNMEFSYENYLPENPRTGSDSLRNHIKQVLKNWYGGNDWISVEIDNETIPVKVDGNRRIMVFKEDGQRILVRVHDISHPDYRHKGMRFLTKGKEEKE